MSFLGKITTRFRGGRLLALSFVLIFLCACAEESSVEQQFVDAFVEVRVAEVTYGNGSATARLVRQDILKKYGYTREQFLAQSEAVLADEKLWLPFQKAVTARVDTLIAEMNPPKLPAALQPSLPARKGGVQ